MLQMFLAIPILLSVVVNGEAVPGSVDHNTTYRLIEIDTVPFQRLATISFPAPGTIRGKGPCNSFAAELTAPLPRIQIGAIRATRRGCPDLAQETLFFNALESMMWIEISGATLILRNEAGRELVFQAEPR
ncbi:MAG: META domain-containing protein [Paracoccaceae bacterium]